MKKLKIYLDTTVISFLKAEDALDKMNVTQQFWDLAKQKLTPESMVGEEES